MVLAVRQFVDKEIAPAAPAHERARRLPDDLVAALADLGLFGALVPAEHGGLGLDLGTYAMLLEELGRGWSVVAATVASHGTVAATLARAGTAGAQRRLLPLLARAERLATTAFGRPVAARDEGSTRVIEGDAGLVDGAGRAALFLVLTAPAVGPRGLALLERGTPGVAIGDPAETLGGRGLDPRTVRLAGVRVPADLGPPGQGSGAGQPGAAPAALALERLGIAATAVGVAQAAFEAALRYSQQRSTFGQPICQHQAIQLKLADMATRITVARLLTGRAAERLDVDSRDDAGSIMARLVAGDTAYAVSLEAMRIHGGYGYTSEFPVERCYRDAAALLLGPREPAAERKRLAARWLAGQQP
jgi:alkylation response protein AidB-like acyl-CoA dehydrogenase